MSFEEMLDAARLLAAEHTQLGATIRSMATAEDHDPRWSASDTAELDAKVARQRDVAGQILAALEALERDHREAWRAFLVDTTARLAVLASGEKGQITAEYEHGLWALWSQGTAPEEPAEIFARGLDACKEV